MINTILVPLDGHSYSEQALEHAAALAARSGARVRIVHVLDGIVPPPFAADITSYEWSHGAAAAAANAYLRAHATRIHARGVHTAYAVLQGSPASTIMTYAKRSCADLIVMATHGRGPVQRVIMGNVADQIANHADVPVMFIRVSDEEPVPPPRHFRRVLVALDGSTVAEGALDAALEIARLDEGRLVLFCVSYPTVAVLPVTEPNLVTSLAPVVTAPLSCDPVPADYVATVKESLGDGAVTIDTEISMSIAPPDVEIGRYVEDNDVDLIALGTRGHSVLRCLLGLSVTERTVRHSRVPVLVCRSG